MPKLFRCHLYDVNKKILQDFANEAAENKVHEFQIYISTYKSKLPLSIIKH